MSRKLSKFDKWRIRGFRPINADAARVTGWRRPSQRKRKKPKGTRAERRQRRLKALAKARAKADAVMRANAEVVAQYFKRKALLERLALARKARRLQAEAKRQERQPKAQQRKRQRKRKAAR